MGTDDDSPGSDEDSRQSKDRMARDAEEEQGLEAEQRHSRKGASQRRRLKQQQLKREAEHRMTCTFEMTAEEDTGELSEGAEYDEGKHNHRSRLGKLSNKDFVSGRALGGHMNTHKGGKDYSSAADVEGSSTCLSNMCDMKMGGITRPTSTRVRSARHSAAVVGGSSGGHQLANRPGKVLAAAGWGLQFENDEGSRLLLSKRVEGEGLEAALLQATVEVEAQEDPLEGEDEDGAKLAGSNGKIHECKYCGRRFPSGRALGGHIRMHNLPTQDGAKTMPGGPAELPGHECHSTGSGHHSDKKEVQRLGTEEQEAARSLGDSDPVTAGMIKYKGGQRIFQCRSCLREFDSGRALGGHMKTHRTGSTESERGSHDSMEVQDGGEGRLAQEGEARSGGFTQDGSHSQSEAEEEVLEGPTAKAHMQQRSAKESDLKRPSLSGEGQAGSKMQRKPKRSKWLSTGLTLMSAPPSQALPAAGPPKALPSTGGRSCICTECGRGFSSWKALFGHMRCHPEREWRGIQRPSYPPAVTSSATKRGSGKSKRAEEKPHPVVATSHNAAEGAAALAMEQNLASLLPRQVELESDSESLESIEAAYVNRGRQAGIGGWMTGKRSKRPRVALRAVQIPPHLLVGKGEVETPAEVWQERQDKDMADWLVLLASAAGEDGEHTGPSEAAEEEDGEELEGESRTEAEEEEEEADDEKNRASADRAAEEKSEEEMEEEEEEEELETDTEAGEKMQIEGGMGCREETGKEVEEQSMEAHEKMGSREEEVVGNWIAIAAGKGGSRAGEEEVHEAEAVAMEDGHVEGAFAANDVQGASGAQEERGVGRLGQGGQAVLKADAGGGAGEIRQRVVAVAVAVAGAAGAAEGSSEQGEASSGRYACTTCNKVFKSHQALGGHRASHRKVKKPLQPRTLLAEASGTSTAAGEGDAMRGRRLSAEKARGGSQDGGSAPSSAVLSDVAAPAHAPAETHTASQNLLPRSTMEHPAAQKQGGAAHNKFTKPAELGQTASAFSRPLNLTPGRPAPGESPVAGPPLSIPGGGVMEKEAHMPTDLVDEGSSLRTGEGLASGLLAVQDEGLSAEQRVNAGMGIQEGSGKVERGEEEGSEGGSTGAVAAVAKTRAHACSICQRVFSSGQALGGHKRCHWGGTLAGAEGGASASPEPSSISTESAPAGCEVPARNGPGLGSVREKGGNGRPPSGKEEFLDLNLPAPEEEAAVSFKPRSASPAGASRQEQSQGPVSLFPAPIDLQAALKSKIERGGLARNAGSSSDGVPSPPLINHGPLTRPLGQLGLVPAHLRPAFLQAPAGYLAGAWLRPHGQSPGQTREEAPLHSSPLLDAHGPYGAIRSVLPTHILASLGIRDDDLKGVGIQWLAAGALGESGIMNPSKEGFQRVRSPEVGPSHSPLPHRLEGIIPSRFSSGGDSLTKASPALFSSPTSNLSGGWGLLAGSLQGGLRPGMQDSLGSNPPLGFHSMGMASAGHPGLLLGQPGGHHSIGSSQTPTGKGPMVDIHGKLEESRPMEASL